jgi:hypothetical protein
MRSPRILALVVALAATGPARAQDSVVKVFDSTLNKLADKVQPLTVRGTYRASIFVFGLELTLCDSPYTVRVTQLRFATSPASIQITGRVDATWCGLSFGSSLATTADATYSASQRAIVVRVGSTSIQPRFSVLGLDLVLPVSVNVGPTFDVPPLPIGVAQLGVQGIRGPVTLRFEPRNVSLTRRSGHLELQSDFTVW